MAEASVCVWLCIESLCTVLTAGADLVPCIAIAAIGCYCCSTTTGYSYVHHTGCTSENAFFFGKTVFRSTVEYLKRLFLWLSETVKLKISFSVPKIMTFYTKSTENELDQVLISLFTGQKPLPEYVTQGSSTSQQPAGSRVTQCTEVAFHRNS